ncbi:MAG: orotate phosphoribosyltransferase [Planctomycetes bacterium GWA2_40_7]|nr:MAG: orotate phosphoribosyltransferase [Planctomycetes bacterium GWA2_40_7]OHB49392.1 MAG: orotate phosphoribosyltransferase [Planctomycetes bacterium GWF2_40_8]OHB89440.1 MAG: orotate phosphoribosyltransferase [Planctomycetes bacterium RIFCSPHIGHO2_02_FULL_40_12]OHC03190.1 MAG: orotate phosphoribosyltransferase [Planctomycetes bacterium RIFCSPLOWO2_12_FULL_40_19]
MDLKQLGKEIVETSYVEGEFILSSGRRSTYIFDKYAFETRPKLLDAIAESMAKMVNSDVSRIAGMELGGVPLATALSLKTGLPFVIVRKGKKGYGIDRSIEGDLTSGEKVVIVEDIATTGAQALLAAKTIEEAGAKVSSIVYVVDREEGAREGIVSKGYRFEALFTKSGLGV